MKKYLLISILLLSMLTACNRSLRRDQNPALSSPSAVQETPLVASTPTAVTETPAAQVLSTDTPNVQPADTLTPTVDISQSDILANQLDALLGQFNSELQNVDTIPETP